MYLDSPKLGIQLKQTVLTENTPGKDPPEKLPPENCSLEKKSPQKKFFDEKILLGKKNPGKNTPSIFELLSIFFYVIFKRLLLSKLTFLFDWVYVSH